MSQRNTWFLKDFMSFIVDPHGPGDPICLTQRVSRGPGVPTLCERETR